MNKRYLMFIYHKGGFYSCGSTNFLTNKCKNEIFERLEGKDICTECKAEYAIDYCPEIIEVNPSTAKILFQ